MTKKSEAEKVVEYIKGHDVKFEDLNEEAKKSVAFIYNRINTIISFIDYNLSPRIKTLEERMPSALVRDVNSLDDFVNNNPLTVVDFWNTACLPCGLVEPVFEKLSKEFVGTRFGRVNIDYHPEDMKRYGITMIPALLFFKQGRVVDKQIGVMTDLSVLEKVVREKIEGMIEKEFEERLGIVERVAKDRGWKVVKDKKVRDTLVRSLVMNELNYGLATCPCRPYIKGKDDYNKKIICPCAFAEDNIKKWGHCYCQLFWDPRVSQKPEGEEVRKHIKTAKEKSKVI